MDIKLPKRPWYVRYRVHLAGGMVLAALVGYAIVLQSGPRTLKVDVGDDDMAVVQDTDFLEYIDVNGLVCPATSMRVNAAEGGTVERICCHNGDLLHRGDTILVLSNPKVLEEMMTERRNFDLQQLQHRQQLIEMQQKSIALRGQALQANYELRKIEQNYELAQEEARMGVRSQAQLQVAHDEYVYNRRRTLLTIESLKHDSALHVIGRQLIEQQIQIESQRLQTSNRREAALVVVAPADGQIGNLNATIGGQVTAGEQVGEIGVLDDYKLTARLNEYYIDRIQSGQSVTAFYKGKTLALQVSRITPQVQEHGFAVEISGGPALSALRPGMTLRLQIELGQPERRLVIPRGNFYAQTGGQWMMRIDPGNPRRARRVPVKLGRQNVEQYEVVDGLAAGDRVIVGGYDRFGDAEVIMW